MNKSKQVDFNLYLVGFIIIKILITVSKNFQDIVLYFKRILKSLKPIKYDLLQFKCLTPINTSS